MSYRAFDSTIRYQDFLPREVTPGGLMSNPTFEPLDSAVAAAGAWVAQNGVEPINVETVVVPFAPGSPTSSALTTTFTSGNTSSFQFVRLWYRARQ